MLAILFAVFFPSPVSPDFSVLSPNKDTEQETLEGMRRGFGVQLALEQQDFNPMGPLTHKCFFNKHSRACLSTGFTFTDSTNSDRKSIFTFPTADSQPQILYRD